MRYKLSPDCTIYRQGLVVSTSAVGSIGYFACGWPGVVAAWLAMVTPSLLVIPLVTLLRRWLHLPRVRGAVDAVVIASAVLLLTSVVRMAIYAFDQLTRVF